MGTRICKIVEEMAEIIESKVGNPKNFPKVYFRKEKIKIKFPLLTYDGP